MIAFLFPSFLFLIIEIEFFHQFLDFQSNSEVVWILFFLNKDHYQLSTNKDPFIWP